MSSELTTKYTKDDFLSGTAPFEEVYKKVNNPFELDREIEKMSAEAKQVGIKNFKTLFKAYCTWQKQVCKGDYTDNASNFDEQPLELNTGEWLADDHGITKEGVFGEVVACVHPIMPTQRLVNIDTGIEKLKVTYKKGKSWRSIIADRRQLASASSIVGLADYGVAVTSETAKHLVQYIHDVENLNYERIPEFNSVGRLGWIGDQGFSPYVEDLIFDGDLSFKHYFDAVTQNGSATKWLEVAGEVRKGSVYARLLLAASFASVLVEPCGCLPFFVHLWGGTETGKTVGLMLAASVWANPEMGKFIHTFNSTSVAQELSAGFVNSLPLILDELQIVKERKDFDNMIYQLSEGVGKSRGQKTGGLQRVSTWNNCIITTGEQPISGSTSGSGAVNRIIEVNCEEIRLFQDPVKVADTVKRNYGFAGKLWIELLKNPDILRQVKELHKALFKQLSGADTTEKQAMSASLILAADNIVTAHIFKDNQFLEKEDIIPFLSTRSEVSQNGRAYEWICEWVAQYKNKFLDPEEGNFDRWGKFDGEDYVFIIRNIFDKHCSENGFNSKSFLTWLRGNNLIEVSGKGFTKSGRIGGMSCNCVVLKITDYDRENPKSERFDLDF